VSGHDASMRLMLRHSTHCYLHCAQPEDGRLAPRTHTIDSYLCTLTNHQHHCHNCTHSICTTIHALHPIHNLGTHIFGTIHVPSSLHTAHFTRSRCTFTFCTPSCTTLLLHLLALSSFAAPLVMEHLEAPSTHSFPRLLTKPDNHTKSSSFCPPSKSRIN